MANEDVQWLMPANRRLKLAFPAQGGAFSRRYQQNAAPCQRQRCCGALTARPDSRHSCNRFVPVH
jgi:hypothetical protein